MKLSINKCVLRNILSCLTERNIKPKKLDKCVSKLMRNKVMWKLYICIYFMTCDTLHIF